MSVMKYDEVKRAVLELKTAKAIANHFGCTERAALNMIFLVESDTKKRVGPETKVTITKPKLSKINPKDDPLEWSWEKEKQMMAEGSYILLRAMLAADQHRLNPMVANEMRKQMGLPPKFIA